MNTSILSDPTFQVPKKDVLRFWPKATLTANPDKCWEWQYGRDKKGYGGEQISGVSLKSHRVAYFLVKGAIPTGLTIDHLCRNTRCINPAHLEAVTNRENIFRGLGIAVLNARKTHCSNGHPFEANSRVIKSGLIRRICRVCKALAAKKRPFDPSTEGGE